MALVSDQGKHLRVDDVTQGLQTTEKPRRFYYFTELQDGVWSDVVIIPKQAIRSISYDLNTAGTASVQCTISSIEDIQAGNAVWREVPDNVELNASLIAIRGRAIGNTGTFTVVAV